MAGRHHGGNTDAGIVLAKAVATAGLHLGLPEAAIARSIGVSQRALARIFGGDRSLVLTSKQGELALLLIRVCRSLDALVGADDQKRIAWMRSPNRALGGIPSKLVERVDGLVGTLDYLDRMRLLGCFPSAITP